MSGTLTRECSTTKAGGNPCVRSSLSGRETLPLRRRRIETQENAPDIHHISNVQKHLSLEFRSLEMPTKDI